MSSTCTIREPSSGEPVTDANTGRVTFPEGLIVYSGPCRVRPAATWGRAMEAGAAEISASAFLITVPFSTTGVRRRHLVRVDTSADPELVGRKLEIRFIPDMGDHITARRLICEEVD